MNTSTTVRPQPAKPLQFKVGAKVDTKFGRGRIVSIWAQGEQHTAEENEYVVKIVGERYPATLGEAGMTLR
jgi:hypothetical protein